MKFNTQKNWENMECPEETIFEETTAEQEKKYMPESETTDQKIDVLQIKCKETEPASDEPWKDDALDRKKCAAKLTEIISGQINPLTISLNGDWGTGKTFLLKRWKLQLEKDGYKAIYFNAWEDDFLNDPLLSILGQLQSVIGGEFKDELKKTSKAIWTFSKNALIRSATFGFGDPNELKNDKDIYDIYEELKNSKNELNNVIQKFILKNTDFKHKIIFIIDELDRCRPTYAIEVLERIKHFFNIDNLIFVLGVARKELEKTIKSVYGDIDIENYLHRFIDIEFILPYVDNSKFIENLLNINNIEKYINNDIEKSKEVQKIVSYNKYKEITINIKSHFKIIFLWKNFTLREIEQCFKIYILLLNTSIYNKDIDPLVLLLVIIIRIKNNNLYSKFINKKSSFVEICDFLIPEKDYYEENELMTATYINIEMVRIFYNISLEIHNGINNMINRLKNNNDVSKDKYASNFIKKHIETNNLDNSEYSKNNKIIFKDFFGEIAKNHFFELSNHYYWNKLEELIRNIDLFFIK